MVQLSLTEISDEESPAADAQTIELEEMSNFDQSTSDYQVQQTNLKANGMCAHIEVGQVSLITKLKCWMGYPATSTSIDSIL